MTEVNTSISSQALTEEEVVQFLREQPEFFVKHEYLLNELKVPHESGSAISLGERQVQVFREHRDQLRTQLNEFIEAARDNDKHFEKSKRLLLNLLEVNGLDEVELVINSAFIDDEKIDFAKIVIFGNPDEYPATSIAIESRESARDALGTAVDSKNAVCGRFTDKQLDFIFHGDSKEVGSAAIIPLRNSELFGVFALGSKDEEHFDSAMGSLFLSYISDFITRLLPNLLMRSRSTVQQSKIPSLLD